MTHVTECKKQAEQGILHLIPPRGSTAKERTTDGEPQRRAQSAWKPNMTEQNRAKVRKVSDGCLGTCSRRKTQQAAKRRGEPQAGSDPRTSEWGNPYGTTRTRAKRGEPGEVKHLSSRRKRNRRDPLSSGERKGASPNRMRAKAAAVAHTE